MTMQWGILGPGTIESVRRVRTLDLTPCVRLFNELAVPGLGGVWFGKQLFLATLGVLVAEQANERGCRVTKITVANAIEAIACWLALTGEPRTNGGRVLGSTKLVGHDSYSFSKVSQLNFYVTTPMRTSTVTALPALGLVEASGNCVRPDLFYSIVIVASSAQEEGVSGTNKKPKVDLFAIFFLLVSEPGAFVFRITTMPLNTLPT